MLNSERPSKSIGVLALNGQDLTIDQVNAVARRRQPLMVTEDQDVRDAMRRSTEVVQEAVDQGWRVYGVTTGFGSMAEVPVPAEFAAASQTNLLSFLTTGAGACVDPLHVRAAMVLRANMLLRGVSGVRVELVERLVQFLEADAIPVVRELGSIGASGDLVPLATVARAITGAGSSRVCSNGRELDGNQALSDLELDPIDLLPKEGLALINGTSFSSAIAANCIHESRRLLALALASHAMMIRALSGFEEPFMPFVHECKPHPGQMWTAQMMRELLERNASTNGQPNGERLQDRYSLRCLPQYTGAIVEGVERIARVVHIEMNGVTDNPLVDSDENRFYQSGNFLGQYVGMAMDELRNYLGLVAKHLDVQIAQLVSPEFNNGLPASLQGNDQLSYNMGLKGLQITGNSIMPLLTQLAAPLVLHYPTHAEQHNQNVNGLSWGAAQLAWKSVELLKHYTSLSLIFAVQAVDLRAQVACRHSDGRCLMGSMLASTYEAVYETVGRKPGDESPFVFNDADQSLEEYVDRISTDISDEGATISTVLPILDSLKRADL